jgi:hypothetical protein
MHTFHVSLAALVLLLFSMLMTLLPQNAQALPTFARQTGQNCVACHAGGQFPELTPYGRLFKMTGYTIGVRTQPFAVMGVVTSSSIAKPSADPVDNAKSTEPIFATGSVFIAGKITDNIGAFSQFTYDPYAVLNDDGSYSGQSGADNIDIRFADHIVSDKNDWIYGVSLNNHPSLTDPWNTVTSWSQYVPVPTPTSSQYIDGAAPFPGFPLDGSVAGLNAYMFWNQTIYADVGLYHSADKAFSFLSLGANPPLQLSGSNPYWRLALSHEWGPHNLMVGATGMIARVYDDPADISDPASIGQFNSQGFDAQYQYLLNPHTVTAQLAYMKTDQRYSEAVFSGGSDTTTTTRAKLTYTYQAKYGGSISAFDRTGSNNIQQFDPLNYYADPATNGMTYEAFFIPKQNVRIGVQYTTYNTFEGASTNYGGKGRNASDNNSMFLYLWFAY